MIDASMLCQISCLCLPRDLTLTQPHTHFRHYEAEWDGYKYPCGCGAIMIVLY